MAAPADPSHSRSTAFVRSGRDWFNIGDSKCTQVDPRVVESVSLLALAVSAHRADPHSPTGQVVLHSLLRCKILGLLFLTLSVPALHTCSPYTFLARVAFAGRCERQNVAETGVSTGRTDGLLCSTMDGQEGRSGERRYVAP